MPDTDMVGLVQFNCRGSFAAMCELGGALCGIGCSFAIVQEPYTSGGVVRGLPGYVRSFVDSVGDSAVLVLDPGVTCAEICRDSCGVCVLVEGAFGRLLLVGVYCRYSAALEPYLGFMDSVLQRWGDIPTIFGLDANAASPLWFSKMPEHSFGYRNYSRGIVLSEWILARGVGVLNRPSELYTFDSATGASDIDVTIANGPAFALFDFDWKVRDDWGVSDHHIIEVVISCRVRPAGGAGVDRRWCRRPVDWQYYGDCVREAARVVPIGEFGRLSLVDRIGRLYEWVDAVNDDLLGRYRVSGRRSVRWWTRELTRMRMRVRHLRKRFQRGRRASVGDLARRRADYLSALRAYRDRIVEVKEEEWRGFLRRNRDDPWGRVYRVFRRRGGNGADLACLRIGGSVLSSWGECVAGLLRAFFPDGGSADPRPLGEARVGVPGLERWEIEVGVGRVRCRRSPGVDGMTGEMCKSIWKAIPEYLESVFSDCVAEGHFPDVWKVARVVILLKSPDRVRSNPRSYRGISLLPVLGKVLEGIMVSRLREVCDGSLSDRQFGFREGRSVEDAWFHVRRSVSGSSANYVLGIFVDFRGAFDHLLWDRVLLRLAEVGCRELGLWSSYFRGRRACVVGPNGTVWREVVRGCPQGSICGPFIWNLMMDPLLRRLSSSFGVCAYADDLLILVEGQSRADLERKGVRAMGMACEWGREVGVEVAMDKTVMMLLRGRLSAGRPPIIRIGAAGLRYVTEVKYLGISMTEGLNFLVHLDRVRERLTGVMGELGAF